MLSFGHPQPYQLSLSQDCWTKGVGNFRTPRDSGNESLPTTLLPHPPTPRPHTYCWLSELKGTFFYLLTEGKLWPRGNRDLPEGMIVLPVQGTLALNLSLEKTTWGQPLGRLVTTAEACGDRVSVEAPDGIGRVLGKQPAGWALAPARPDLQKGSLRIILF